MTLQVRSGGMDEANVWYGTMWQERTSCSTRLAYNEKAWHQQLWHSDGAFCFRSPIYASNAIDGNRQLWDGRMNRYIARIQPENTGMTAQVCPYMSVRMICLSFSVVASNARGSLTAWLSTVRSWEPLTWMRYNMKGDGTVFLSVWSGLNFWPRILNMDSVLYSTQERTLETLTTSARLCSSKRREDKTTFWREGEERWVDFPRLFGFLGEMKQ